MSDRGEPGEMRVYGWYCRVCGASREGLSEIERDVQALSHLAVCNGGLKTHIETKVSGYVLHVWSW